MTMTVDLGDLTEVVDQLVRTGRYKSRDILLAAAVRLLQQRETQRDALLAELQVGLDDLAAGRSYSIEEVEAEMKALRKARLTPKAA